MASSTMTSILSVTLCILLLALTTTSAFTLPDQPAHHCFRYRVPMGKRGKCIDEIPAPGSRTIMLDPRECCELGGEGWSEKVSGKRCVDPCQEIPAPRPDDSRRERLEAALETVDAKIPPPNDTAIWSQWSVWSNCSAPCGVGNITRTRTCLTEIACNGSLDEEEVFPCDTNVSCPVDERWSDWSDCDHTDPCRPVQSSHRTCVGGGPSCRGPSTRTRPCRRGAGIHCPVDGGWSTWAAWTNCPAVSCDEVGWVWRIRQCNNPEPQGEGAADCNGVFLEKDQCTGPC